MNAITAAGGFVASGIHAGLKSSGKRDLSCIATGDGRPVDAAAVFTTNKLAAAPVRVSRSNLAESGGKAAAVLINSGSANAATGQAGLHHAEEMCRLTAKSIHCQSEEVLVCSTGLIGTPIPMGKLEKGIPDVVQALSPGGGNDAALGILTTDSVPKQVVHRGTGFTVGGMAKGSGMLEPNMATMLAFVTTDAPVDSSRLREILTTAVDLSFNRLTVDGAQSTNDTVIALASGAAGTADTDELQTAFNTVCYDLAMQMADDAEGSTRTVVIRVEGASSDDQALQAARAVANNQLIKCSWYGQNAYWGRIAAEAGASGVDFDFDKTTIYYGDIATTRGGVEIDYDARAVAEHFQGRRLRITIDFGLGAGNGEIITTDLSHAYVDENMGKS